MRTIIHIILIFCASSFGFAQEYTENLTTQKSLNEKRFDISFCHGAHLINPFKIKERNFNSNVNFSLDFKIQFRPNWFLGVTNRIRIDNYFLPIPDHALTQSEIINEYVIWSHALFLEKRFVLKKIHPFFSFGLGITFTHPSGIGWRYNVNQYSAKITYNDFFISAGAQNGNNIFSMYSGGFDYHFIGKFFIRPCFSLAYLHGDLMPIIPTTVNNDGKIYILASQLKRFHPIFYLGLAYKFN